MRELYLAQQEANQRYEQVYPVPDTVPQGDSAIP